MPRVPLIFPDRGIADADPKARQSVRTTRDCRNVRDEQPASGQEGGGSRSGSSPFNPNQLDGANRVQAVGSLQHANPLAKTVALAIIAPAWTTKTPSKGACKNIKLDAQENLYVIDGGTGVAKLNPDKQVVWKVSLPVADQKHEVRALAVDEVSLDVFVAVTSGGDHLTAKIFRVIQLPDNKAEVDWELTVKRYVKRMRLRQGLLYTVQDEPSRNRAFVVIYGALESAKPVETLKRLWAYPSTDIVVRDDGSFYASADANPIRGLDPLAPGAGPKTLSWDFQHLAKSSERLWWHGDAHLLSGDPEAANDFEEGEEIGFVGDRTEKHRDLKNSTAFLPSGGTADVIMRAPTFRDVGLGGEASLVFRGKVENFEPAGSVTPEFEATGLEAVPNPSIAQEMANSQHGFLPAFKGCAFAVSMLFRPHQGETWETAAEAVACIFNVPNQAPAYVTAHGSGTSQGGIPYGPYINRDEGSGSLPGTKLEGEVCLYEPTVGSGWPAHGTTNNPVSAPPGDWLDNNPTGALLITILHDGGLGGSDDTAAGTVAPNATRSMFLVNGKQYDRWASHEIEAMLRQTIGWLLHGTTAPITAGFLRAEFVEGVSLVRRRDAAGVLVPIGGATEPLVLSHPIQWDAAPLVPPYPAGYDSLAFLPATMPADLGGAAVTALTNELQLIEGRIMHRAGVQSALVVGHPWRTNCPPAPGVTTGGQNDPQRLHHTGPIIAKFDAKGNLVWAATDQRNQIDAVTSADLGGVGYSAVIEGSTLDDVHTFASGTRLFTLGPGKGADASNARVIVDLGTKYATTGTGAAGVVTLPVSYTIPPIDTSPEIAVDEFENIWIVWHSGAGATWTLAKKATFASGFASIVYDSSGVLDAGAYVVAVPQKSPDWAPAAANKTSEHVYLGLDITDAGGAAIDAIQKITLATVTPVPAQPTHILTLFGIAGGKLKKVTPAAITAPAGTGTLAQPEFDPTATYISWCTLNGEIFISDRKRVLVFSPKLDRVVEYKVKGPGEGLLRPSLLFTWRARLGQAAAEDNRSSYRMARVGEPYDMDIQPPVLDAARAIDGSNSLAAQPPQAINAVLSFNDDLLIWLCDSAVYRLTGDPAAGGITDLITSEIGGSFGDSACKDERGRAYFDGSKGGVYSMDPLGAPVEISDGLIARRLRLIDRSLFRIVCVWNDEDKGVHVVPVPYGATNVAPIGWFWHRKKNAWYQDDFNPAAFFSAMHVPDADDPTKRVLLMGRSDGRIARWDRAAETDDGFPITSYVDFAPLHGNPAGVDVGVYGSDIELASDGGGAEAQWFACDSADRGPGGSFASPSVSPPQSLGEPALIEPLSPGWNGSTQRVAAPYVYLRIASRERWALRKIEVDLRSAGLTRGRRV